MKVEKMNVDSLLAQSDESEEATYVKPPVPRRAMKVIGASLLMVAILFSGATSFKSATEEKQTEALYAQTAVVVEKWSENFVSIGESTLILDNNKIKNGAERSIALSELSNELRDLEVQANGKTLNLQGMKINLKKDKSFTLEEGLTSEIVFDSKEAASVKN